MSGQWTKGPVGPSDTAENALLEKLGIERVPADRFLWGGYSYTEARDAIAAARRGERR